MCGPAGASKTRPVGSRSTVTWGLSSGRERQPPDANAPGAATSERRKNFEGIEKFPGTLAVYRSLALAAILRLDAEVMGSIQKSVGWGSPAMALYRDVRLRLRPEYKLRDGRIARCSFVWDTTLFSIFRSKLPIVASERASFASSRSARTRRIENRPCYQR